MTQFLWIEDFENNPQATATSVFGSILSDIELPDTKEEIRLALRECGIFIELTFLQGLGFIRNFDKLAQIDYVVIDIDLSVKGNLPDKKNVLSDILKLYGYDTDAENLTESRNQAELKLKKTAGYQLYVELVMKLGFPPDHILFCSNHGEELNSIRDAFTAAKMQWPLVYTKNEEKSISQWIVPRRSNPYFILRRGIIEGYREILNLLQTEGEKAIRFRDVVKEAYDGTPIRQVSLQDVEAYLQSLQYFLPLREPRSDEEKRRYYKLFLRTLTHEWDSADPRKFNRTENGAFCQVMKHCRNWASHSKVLDDLNEQDTAFLFLIAMRAMFELDPQKVMRHEKTLLGLFENVPAIDDMKRYIGVSFRDRQIPLAKTYHAAQSTADNEGVRKDTVYFDGILNTMQQAGIQSYDYVTGLYQIFWHGLSHAHLKPHRQHEQVYINFAFHDYGQAANGFLFEFARHIYERSFKA